MSESPYFSALKEKPTSTLNPTKAAIRRGERHGRAKLTEAQVRAILADGRKSRAISRDYPQITNHTIEAIKARKIWGWLDAEVADRNPHLRSEQAIAIRADPRPCKVIAKAYGVHSATVFRIKNLQAWAHLKGPVVWKRYKRTRK